ncbi:MAG: HAMP domain-containing sensor histidine kinase [Clostridiaceae bacterium]
MDIRLRNIKYASGIKLLAVIICILGMLLMSFGLLEAPHFENAIGKDQYLGSSANTKSLGEFYKIAYEMAFVFKSEDNIKSANLLSDIIPEYKRRLSENMNHSIASINDQYLQWINVAKESENDKEIARLEDERDKLIQDQQLQMNKELEQMIQNDIQNQLAQFYSYIDELENADGVYYYALTPDKAPLTNIGVQSDAEAFFKGLPVYMTGERQEAKNHISSYSGYTLSGGAKLYTVMTEERFLREQQAYNDNKAIGLNGIYQSLAGLVIYLIGLFYLLYSAGRRPGMEGVHLLTFDRLYLDIGLVVVIGIAALYFSLLHEMWYNIYETEPGVFYTIGALMVISGTILSLVYLTMAAKRIKRREFIRSNLIYAIPAFLFRYVKRLCHLIKSHLNAGPLNVRTALLFISYASATTISVIITIGFAISQSGFGVLFGILLVLAINIAAFIFILKRAKALSDITKGVQRIRTGDFSNRITGNGDEEMSILAENINHMADGLKEAVESEVKAERLKAELVTNVSHDLKTPLTSIITYIDLLKTEGFQSENAARYVEILEKKSNRLKTLTEDLFEAAKAASGSIAVNLEQLDAGALLSQGMGELSDRINASGLDFKVSIPEEKVLVKADGRLLWRVVENLLSNIFKYALAGSRVYIDIINDSSRAHLVFKNISEYELNISPDELTERFKRGDQSRNSEGSGLGLSIAKSLTELQGGIFRINIDGDLFKATVTLST